MSPWSLRALLKRSNRDAAPSRASNDRDKEEIVDERIISLRCADAREEERRRVAVDLHDGPIQNLVNLVLRLEMAAKAVPPDAEPLREELENLRRQAKDVLQEMRRFIFELRPASLDEFFLLPALRQYVQDYRTQYGIPVELQISDTDWSLDRHCATNLFRIIQEALTNVRKHAGATRVAVDLRQDEGQVTARVWDDGKGFDVDAARQRAHQEKRMGLFGMEDRARALGGSLGIESSADGTLVQVTIPHATSGSRHGQDTRSHR